MEVENFLHNLDASQKEVAVYLHKLMVSFPGVVSKIRYKIPFYYQKSWICYLNPSKKNQIEFAFTRGNELSNEQGLLDSKGRKQISGITFTSINDIPKESLIEIIQEALLLDTHVPYASKRKKV